MKKQLFSLLLLGFAAFCPAQSNIDRVLDDIRRNNKTIQSNASLAEAQKLQFQTGIFLYNPTAEYDYLKGSPAEAGNQTDVTITQSFDFPTSYSRRKQLSKQQIAHADLQLKASNQEILFEAQRICIELVFRNKLQMPLETRKAATEKWLSQFEKRLKHGDGNILDVNKAALQLIAIRREFNQNLSQIRRLSERLTSLNGGETVVFADTAYFELPMIPDFETLEKEIEQNDPTLKVLEQEKAIADKQIELSKALTYPKMELGYRYQGILGQTYNGFHTGVSIPLWENKNTVKLQQAKSELAMKKVSEHTTEHYFDIKQLYGQYENLKATLADYKSSINARENIRLLDKAFSLGHFSTIEYFTEVQYYNDVFNDYLETERQLYEVVATLLKYKL